MRSARRVVLCLGIVLLVAGPGALAQEPPGRPSEKGPAPGVPESDPAGRPEEPPARTPDGPPPGPTPRWSPLYEQPGARGDPPPALPSSRPEDEWVPFGDVFQLRAFQRHGFLHGNTIGRAQGFFLGQAPKATDAWADSIGFGLSAEWWVMPLLALQTTVSYEVFPGKTLRTPVDRVEFDDLGLLKSSVGARLNLPFGLPLHRWTDPPATEDWKGVVPYLRSGIGLAVTQGVDVRLSNGQRVNYFAQSGSFLFTIAFGLEARMGRFGLFAEVLPFEAWGPVESARDPEAKDWHGSEFPFTVGLSWRF